MSDPTPERQHCCPIARHLGKITLAASLLVAALLTLLATRSLVADDKPFPPTTATPTKEAVVLFDGKDLTKWQK